MFAQIEYHPRILRWPLLAITEVLHIPSTPDRKQHTCKGVNQQRKHVPKYQNDTHLRVLLDRYENPFLQFDVFRRKEVQVAFW